MVGQGDFPSTRREKGNLSFLCLFVLSVASMNYMLPTYIIEGRPSLLTLLVQMLIFLRNTPTDISRNNVLPTIWAPFSPVKLTPKSIHHSVCACVCMYLCKCEHMVCCVYTCVHVCVHACMCVCACMQKLGMRLLSC